MIKHYCDSCGDEITDRNECKGGTIGRFGAIVKSADARSKLQVEVLTVKDGTANAGDFCKYCVLDALQKLDDRPQATASATKSQGSQ